MFISSSPKIDSPHFPLTDVLKDCKQHKIIMYECLYTYVREGRGIYASLYISVHVYRVDIAASGFVWVSYYKAILKVMSHIPIDWNP